LFQTKADCSVIGITDKQVLTSLEKLLDANVISRKNGKWQPHRLRKIYGIKKLISVEAKFNNIQ
jgi:predicted transcriptional regulator